MQKHCMSIQECDENSQSPCGVESDGECEGQQEDFYMNTSSKRKIRENLGPLLNGLGNMVTKDTEKLERYSVPSWLGKTGLQESQAL